MVSVNVNRNVSDAFYRYKMPRIQAKVEGKGNGIKTVIVNMVDVAKAIGRPATYPTLYFGCELGVQIQFDFRNERFIVNGSHDATTLQDLLDGFIRKYVLCPACDNPETELMVSSKRGAIFQDCKACSHHGRIMERNHKLNTYILKNPPSLNSAVQGSSLTEGNRSKHVNEEAATAATAVTANDNDQSGSLENELNNSADIVVEPPPERTVRNKLTKKGYLTMTSKTILILLGAIAIAASAIPTVTTASPRKRQEPSQTSEEIRKTIEKTTEGEQLIVIDDEQNNFSNLKMSNSNEQDQDITTPSPETKERGRISTATFLGILAGQAILIIIICQTCGGSCIGILLIGVLIISAFGLIVSYFY